MNNKFKNKIKKEAIIKSIICSLSITLIIQSALIILCKRIPLSINLWIHIVLDIIICSLSFYLLLKFVFPVDEKTLAHRLDKDANLKERVQTMIEFKENDSLMASLQRNDTMEKLDKLPTKTLKMKFSFSNFILSIIAIGLFVTMFFIPSKPINPNGEDETSSSNNEQTSQENSNSTNESSSSLQDSTIDQIIDDMKSEVSNNEDLNSENKEDILDNLDDLKEQLKDPNTENKEEQIDNSKEEINQEISDQITKDKIGEALQNQETTKEIGVSISNGDIKQTKQDLDNLKDSLNDEQLKQQLENIANDINNALLESGVDEADELYQAFSHLSENLNNNASNINDANIYEQINQSFEQAKQEISDALNSQNSLQQLQESLNQQLDDLKDKLSSSNNDNSNEDNGEEGEGDHGSGGNGAGSGNGDIIYAADDIIYDPISGKHVTYGEVLEYYYGQMIGEIENGELPEDIEKIINDYFSSLYFTGDE